MPAERSRINVISLPVPFLFIDNSCKNVNKIDSGLRFFQPHIERQNAVLILRIFISSVVKDWHGYCR
jgi:hypothetical protein